MDSNIVKFPFAVSRRAHARKPRTSINGTPEERAAAAIDAAEIKMVPAGVVESPVARAEARSTAKRDRRSLRGSPLREKVGPISFAVTIVGKIHTADLREEPLDLDAAEREAWLQDLYAGAWAARLVADELDRAAERLTRAQGIAEPTTKRIMAKYDALSPELKRFVSEEVDRILAEQSAEEPA